MDIGIEREAKARDVIGEVLRRLHAQEPVTETLLEELPEGMQVSMPITVGLADGATECATLWIENPEGVGPRIRIEKHTKH